MSESTSTASCPAQVFLVEDHPVVREGLTLLIGGEGDLTVCGASASLADAASQIQALQPDVVVVDLSLGDGNGLDLIEQLHHFDPKLPILALSMHDEMVYAERALRAGARGYVMKSQAMDEVRAAIRKVLGGDLCLSDRVSQRMVRKLISLRVPDLPSLVDSLTDREFQVFRLIAGDIGPTEIAKRLNLSVKTIETHREHIKEKLSLPNGAELRRFALEWSSKGR